MLVALAGLGVAAAGPASCISAEGKSGPCGPGNDQCNAFQPFGGAATPQFHVMDVSCAENDPNAPCYDPKNGVYHLMYQDHVGLNGKGPVFGHAVSRDMIHWSHMPVTIWNDQTYDSQSIYSGSCVNDVDGTMTLIYPGVCKKGEDKDCDTGTTLNLAFPADPSDPLSTNFTKPSYNPIAQINQSAGKGGGGPPGGGGDPSAAFQTASKEWRVVTRDSEWQVVWGSMDFKHWYRVGPQPNFRQGACPSFYPLPATTAGAGPGPKPTHVYMFSDTVLPPPQTHQTVAVVGDYTDKGVRIAADFDATSGVARGLTPQIVDNGTYYAGKDFYDPVKKRRILWGWLKGAKVACNSLPREITWHPQLQQLVFSPLEEQQALRGKLLANLSAQQLQKSAPLSLGTWPNSVGNQSEVVATFALPCSPTTFGVGLMTDATGKATVEAYVAYTAAAAAVGLNDANHGSWQVEVGIRPTGGNQASYSAKLQLLPTDTELEVRVFTDNTVVEVYFMNGRVALTAPIVATEEAGIALFADGQITVKQVAAWQVNSIWISPENVTSTSPLSML